jgi:hypothetical protein
MGLADDVADTLIELVRVAVRTGDLVAVDKPDELGEGLEEGGAEALRLTAIVVEASTVLV